MPSDSTTPEPKKGGEGGAAPTRYIRTFAGDMETLQAGGTPDLAPYEPGKEPKPIPEFVPEPPPQPEPVAAPAPPPEPPAPRPPAPERVVIHEDISVEAPAERTDLGLGRGEIRPTPNAEARLVESSTLPPKAPEPVPAPPPPPPPAPAPRGPTPIHTYAEDFSERIQSTNASHASVLAAEEDARTSIPESEAPRRSGSVLAIIGGVVLLLLAAGGLAYAYLRFSANTMPVVITPTVTAPIFVDEREEVKGSGAALAQAVAASAERTLPSGQMRLLYLSTSTSPSAGENVFLSLALPAPDILTRNVNADGGMAGIIADGSVEAPFFILSVQSYGDTFSGMLSWEKTMPGDLALFYPPASMPVATSTATSTAPVATSTPLRAAGFTDEVIANHDARVYRDATGRADLVYGYWDQHTLVIAPSEDAFAAILSRLATSRSQS